MHFLVALFFACQAALYRGEVLVVQADTDVATWPSQRCCCPDPVCNGGPLSPMGSS